MECLPILEKISKKLNIPKLNVNLGKKMINTQMKLIQNISQEESHLRMDLMHQI